MSQNPPTWSRSLIPDSDDEFVDDAYSRAELERKDWDELRAIASAVETDAVNGKSSREEIEDALTGHKRVEVDV
jgi:hypothetical protein